MSITKRVLEDRENKYLTALQIAIDAKVVNSCPHHDDVMLEGDNHIDDAYKIGNARITSGELTIFNSRREMTDAIKEAVEDNSADECYSCAKHRDE